MSRSIRRDDIRALSELGLPEAVRFVEGLGLVQRIGSQATELGSLREELAELRQQYSTLYADVIQSFSRAGPPFASRGQQGRREEPRRQSGTAG